MSVELRIEELILHGFAPGDRHRIGDAAERELSRLFSEEGVPPSVAAGAAFPSLEGGALEMAPGLGADAVGARVARALYEGMAG